jgi:hypothetical protein
MATLGQRAYPTFMAFWQHYNLLTDEVERFNPEQRDALARLLVRGPIGEAIRRHVNAENAVPVDSALLESEQVGNVSGAPSPAEQAGRDCESPVDFGGNASAASSPGKQLDREAQLAGIRKSTSLREDCEGGSSFWGLFHCLLLTFLGDGDSVIDPRIKDWSEGDSAETQDNSPVNPSSQSTLERRYT